MPSYIVKPVQDVDEYVEWSTIVDSPIRWGSREDFLFEGFEEARLDRADTYSSSALYYRPSWEDDHVYIFEQTGYLYRSQIPALLRIIENGHLDTEMLYKLPEIIALLTPFEDEDDD